MAEILWYYAHGDEQLGPVSSAELKRLAEAADLSPDDLVWREGMEDWAPAQRVKGLFPVRETAEGEAASERAIVAPPAPPIAHAAGPPAAPPAPPPAPALAAAVATLPVAQPAAPAPIVATIETTAAAEPVPPAAAPAESLSPGLRTMLFGAQGILWATCVMVVILGGALFMLTMVEAKSKTDQAASAQVSATLFIGAYVLARAGERACLLLEKVLTKKP
jgi:hypothetical protein